MDATAVIDSYINSVAAALPRQLRNDIGMELRSLLSEELASDAAGSGRPVDGKLALEVVRRFGRPEEVAARYSPRGFHIVEPEFAPLFVKLAMACVAVQWALTLPAVFAGRSTAREWWVSWGIGALVWVGLLVLWFGLASWVRRRSPADAGGAPRQLMRAIFWLPVAADWRPVDRDAIDRRAELGALPLGIVFTIFFIAPAWFLGFLHIDTAWVRYDEVFRQRLLPFLITIMLVRLMLCAVAGFNARLRPQLEALRLALMAGFVALLVWTLLGWHIFASPITDSLFKAWLAIFALVNVIQLALKVRRVATRVRLPKVIA